MVAVHPSFDTALYKILNAIGDIIERTCNTVVFYVANKFLWFDFIWDSSWVVYTIIVER